MSTQEKQGEAFSGMDFSQAEYDDDLLDAFEEELGGVLQNPESSLRGVRSVLLEKLEVCPNGDFYVTQNSRYCDAVWNLTEGNLIKFDSQVPGMNELKRALMFHLLPEYSPWGGVRSDNTVHTVGYSFVVVEDYVFSENKLSATADELPAIDSTKLNEALDKSKNSGYLTTYRNLFFFIRNWLNLSAQKLIPDSLRLNVSPGSVITKERLFDVMESLRSAGGTFKPFAERELSKIFEYALFWVEKGLPALSKVRNLLIDEGVDKGHAKIKTQKKERAEFFEKNLTVVVDGVEVMTPIVNYYERIPVGYSKLVKFWDITWIRPYAHALDCVRNAVFIWIATITGARKRELGRLTAENIIFDDKTGEYSLRITRFKTSNDPTYNGQEDILPLPKFIGDIVREYIALRDVRVFSRVKALFGAHNHSRLGRTNSAHDAYKVIENITFALQKELGIEGIHCHRFRKTIAEILINRDERNIDIIRLLFGHSSYEMTLRYIARNPYLVRSVVMAIEENFTKDLGDIVSGLRSGIYAGTGAKEFADRLNRSQNGFSGKIIRAEIHEYVSHLIRSGENIFIHHTALGAGMYCLYKKSFSENKIIPCISANTWNFSNLPNPKNCQVECDNLIFLDSARKTLHQNIVFYSRLINSGPLNERTMEKLTMKMLISEKRLSEIEMRSASVGKGSIFIQKDSI